MTLFIALEFRELCNLFSELLTNGNSACIDRYQHQGTHIRKLLCCLKQFLTFAETPNSKINSEIFEQNKFYYNFLLTKNALT